MPLKYPSLFSEACPDTHRNTPYPWKVSSHRASISMSRRRYLKGIPQRRYQLTYGVLKLRKKSERTGNKKDESKRHKCRNIATRTIMVQLCDLLSKRKKRVRGGSKRAFATLCHTFSLRPSKSLEEHRTNKQTPKGTLSSMPGRRINTVDNSNTQTHTQTHKPGAPSALHSSYFTSTGRESLLGMCSSYCWARHEKKEVA